MGDAADDILITLGLTAENKKYKPVTEKFTDHFVKKRNTIFERAKFNQRVQESGESVDAFITDLYSLAETCSYGGLREEMIRDRIVVGLQNAKLSERLQLDSTLTLEKAVNEARQSEAVKRQQAVVRGNGLSANEESNLNVDVLHRKWQPRQKKQEPTGVEKERRDTKCGNCGKVPGHPRSQCPAKDVTCHNCQKKGHYKIVCRSLKTIGTVIEEEDYFLGTVDVDQLNVNDGPWKTMLKLDGVSVIFKLDTGADVTVVPEHIFKKTHRWLQESKIKLTCPGQQPLDVCGVFEAQVQSHEKATTQNVYVIRGLKTPLLGRPAIEALSLVSVVQSVNSPGEEIFKKYPTLFQGLGKLTGEYNIKLREDAQPYAVTTPRRIALPLLPKVKEELERLEFQGVISRVEEPTDWCAPIVVVPKQSGSVRLCVDLTKLNDSVRREKHMLPSVEQILAQLSGAKVFSKIDTNSGFHQIPLAKESALLTTFITPFGRFCYNRLPFGITSAPEHFQRRMSETMDSLEGTLCIMDDILIYGSNQEEHDARLTAALDRIQAANLTLNRDKCKFSQESVSFLGQVIDASGIRPDPDKVKAIVNMEEPANKSELRRFLGMANQLGKFSSQLAEISKPLRDLLSVKNEWVWGPAQIQSFLAMKTELSSPDKPLARYDPLAETQVSADASPYGLGAVMTQKQENGEWRPVAYNSRALSDVERRYAQIEKEALAITWACERLSDLLIGKTFHLKTDHKPLIPLLSTKDLDTLPPRIQRFRMRLMRFHHTIEHIPGKLLVSVDALSRAPVTGDSSDAELHEVSQAFVDHIMSSLPATNQQLGNIAAHQQDDDICQLLIQYCRNGWPDKSTIKGPLKLYWPVAAELTVQNGLLMRGCRIVIPASQRMEILEKLHTGHLGIVRCRQRANQSVWWPGIGRQLQELVDNCTVCRQHSRNRAEPMISTELPSLLWQKVATDLLDLQNRMYLLVVDYYSRYVELAKLTSTTSPTIIQHLKSIFARHGVPESVVSDNGPQYSSNAFATFAEEYGFTHITSSPRYAQANGLAERTVQTVKSLLKKSSEPYLALLSYRSTPLEHGFSPAELLMSRRLKTNVPVAPAQLKPSVPDHKKVKAKDSMIKVRQERNFNQHHGARELSPLREGATVWLPDLRTQGIVNDRAQTRSYSVSTPKGQVRRNRKHLNHLPDENHVTEAEKQMEVPPQPNQVEIDSPGEEASKEQGIHVSQGIHDSDSRTTRSGRVIRTPTRYKD